MTIANGISLFFLIFNAARGFYLDLIKGDRAAATYHIAWMAVFLAMLD